MKRHLPVTFDLDRETRNRRCGGFAEDPTPNPTLIKTG